MSLGYNLAYKRRRKWWKKLVGMSEETSQLDESLGLDEHGVSLQGMQEAEQEERSNSTMEALRQEAESLRAELEARNVRENNMMKQLQQLSEEKDRAVQGIEEHKKLASTAYAALQREHGRKLREELQKKYDLFTKEREGMEKRFQTRESLMQTQLESLQRETVSYRNEQDRLESQLKNQETDLLAAQGGCRKLEDEVRDLKVEREVQKRELHEQVIRNESLVRECDSLHEQIFTDKEEEERLENLPPPASERRRGGHIPAQNLSEDSAMEGESRSWGLKGEQQATSTPSGGKAPRVSFGRTQFYHFDKRKTTEGELGEDRDEKEQTEEAEATPPTGEHRDASTTTGKTEDLLAQHFSNLSMQTSAIEEMQLQNKGALDALQVLATTLQAVSRTVTDHQMEINRTGEPEKFGGKPTEAYRPWKDYFLEYCRINRFTDEEKTNHLHMHLVDDARMVMQGLSSREKQDHHAIFLALDRHYAPTKSLTVKRREWERLEKRPKEAWTEFTSKVQIMCNKAYPTSSPRDRIDRCREKVISQLDKEEYMFVLGTCVAGEELEDLAFDTLVKTLENHSSHRQLFTRSAGVRAYSECEEDYVEEVDSVRSRPRRVKAISASETERRTAGQVVPPIKEEVGVKGAAAPAAPTELSAMVKSLLELVQGLVQKGAVAPKPKPTSGGSRGRCFKCDSPDHFVNECPEAHFKKKVFKVYRVPTVEGGVNPSPRTAAPSPGTVQSVTSSGVQVLEVTTEAEVKEILSKLPSDELTEYEIVVEETEGNEGKN